MSSKMTKRVYEYAWQCKDCKHCIKCKRSEDKDKLVYCDQCDRGYHIYCIGLRKIPTSKCFFHQISIIIGYHLDILNEYF